MVAEDALGEVLLDQMGYQGGHGGTVVSAVGQVADENQPPAPRMLAGGVIAQVFQQVVEGIDLSMNVADDVDGSVK